MNYDFELHWEDRIMPLIKTERIQKAIKKGLVRFLNIRKEEIIERDLSQEEKLLCGRAETELYKVKRKHYELHDERFKRWFRFCTSFINQRSLLLVAVARINHLNRTDFVATIYRKHVITFFPGKESKMMVSGIQRIFIKGNFISDDIKNPHRNNFPFGDKNIDCRFSVCRWVGIIR